MELKDKIDNFNIRFDKSKDKKTLLKREIKAYKLLFDDKKLPLSIEIITGNRPILIRKYLNFYTHHDIVLIREAYQRYIVNGADINEAGEFGLSDESLKKFGTPDFKKDLKYERRPLSAFQMHYYNEANMLFEYLKFLKKEANKTQELNKLPKNENINLRRPVAFCFCLLYKDGKYDISTMTKAGLTKFIDENFKEASGQTVVSTLFGYDLSKQKDKALFNYSDKTKSWSFQDDNYKYMIETFPDDYNKALKLFEKFK